jgi:hypothetical protein
MITNRHRLQSPIDVPSYFFDDKNESQINTMSGVLASCTTTPAAIRHLRRPTSR